MKNFKKLIKTKRTEEFPNTFDIVHDAFLKLELDKKTPSYFLKNSSKIVEMLRDESWITFLEYERDFSENIYKSLIKNDIDNFKAREAVENYIHENVDNFYDLSLSNTQSRRSRAGSEFENIISHLFMGANIPFDEQGLIGTGFFEDNNLAKLVDHVVPGAIEYHVDKRNVIAISAKTTLRERWQQIGDEMQRTRMPEMYLATLDEKIGSNTMSQLSANNIYPVTTKKIKKEFYNSDKLVITFEDMLQIAKKKSENWSLSDFSQEQLNQRKEFLENAIEHNSDKPYVINYFKKQLKRFK